MSSNLFIRARWAALTLGLAAATAACTVEKSAAPLVSAPSGFGVTLTSVASPDVLPRDGQSTSTVRFTVRDYQDAAVKGQRLTLTTTGGTLSLSDVTTDANGTATVLFTAPAVTQSINAATITATPVGGDLGTITSGSRTVTIALAGPSVPVVSLTFSPATPGMGDLVTFDGSGTTLSGAPCLDTCVYAWDFGDGNSASGRLASHHYSASGTYAVRLTVTGPGNVIVAASRNIVVGAPAPITATITLSPTDPRVNDTVYFDGSGSTTPDGTAITSYTWDFGNGTSATTKQAMTTFTAPRTYTIRLTIVDALGRTATTTKTITVA